MAYTRQDVDFTLDTLDVAQIDDLLLLQYLDGYRQAGHLVDTFLHLTKGTLTDRLTNGIVAYCSTATARARPSTGSGGAASSGHVRRHGSSGSGGRGGGGGGGGGRSGRS